MVVLSLRWSQLRRMDRSDNYTEFAGVGYSKRGDIPSTSGSARAIPNAISMICYIINPINFVLGLSNGFV